MGFLQNTASQMLESVTGTSSGTNLQNFLQKFGSSAGKYVDTIDPLATFEMYFKFFPNAGDAAEQSWYEKLGSSLLKTGSQALQNAANNITGGLASSIFNNVDVMKKHDEFGKAGTDTFMEYLAPANLLAGSDNWLAGSFDPGQAAASPLELNLGLYIQKATIPNLQVNEDKSAGSIFGELPTSGRIVQPDSHEITLDIINTKASIHERIFYPWMMETTLHYWSYDTQPYTTATVTLDYSKHADLKYIFIGCRPKKIETLQPTQRPEGVVSRTVILNFDFMIVQSNLQTVESLQSKLITTGTTLLNAAASAANL